MGKKILLYVHELSYSGSPFSTLRLSRALKDLGYFVTVWSFKEGPFRKEYESNGIDIEIVDRNLLRKKETLKKAGNFDLLIANSIITREAVEAIRTVIPTVWYIREAENIPDFFNNDFKRGNLLKRVENIWSVSEYAKEFITSFFNKNVTVLHNCVDDEFSEKEYIVKNENDRGDVVKFVVIGSIEYRKGVDVLIDAYNLLSENYKEKCELHLVGRTIESEIVYFNRINKAVENNKNIVYHGEITDRNEMLRLYHEMDVVTVISRDESCSLVALEGAMMQKPLIVSENVGAKYLVDSESGWIVKTGSAIALSEVMMQCIDEKNKLSIMGEVSRKKYLETSTFEKYKENLSFIISNYFVQSKKEYARNHKIDRKVWLIDDLERVPYPKWGYTDENHHLYSFDIFDTLITRKLASPKGIFSIMQKVMNEDKRFSDIPVYVKKNFYQIRIDAEAFARQCFCINGSEDKTFEEIYEAIGMIGQLSSEQIELLAKLEIEMEMKFLIPINENIEKIKKLIESEKRVILISDMYLSSKVIRSILVNIDNIFENIPIYVSSECRKMKGTLNLFKYVQNKEKVSFDNWTHIGDNKNADVRAPKTLGIQINPFQKELLTQYERNALNDFENNPLFQIVTGIVKEYRINNKITKEEEIGLSLGGVILYPYVQWILNDAIRRGFEKLYFVARDGFVLKEIADIIIDSQKLHISTSYFYGSRRAWRMPSFKATDKLTIFFKMAHINQLKNIEELSSIFGIEGTELIKFLPDNYKNIDYELEICDYNIIREFLENNNEFKKFLESKCKEKKRMLQGYIWQEISTDRFAFVELSGTGATQNCLANVIHEKYKGKIYTYFLNLDSMKQEEDTIFINYMPNNLKGVFIIENLCRALHGQTKGYDIKENRFVPILDEIENEELEKHGYVHYIHGVLEYAKRISINKELTVEDKENPILLRRYINHIVNNPCKEVLNFIADMPFESTGYSDKVTRFAPKLNKEQIKQIYLLRDKETIDMFYNGSHFDYSIKRLSKEERGLIDKYRKIAPTNIGHLARIIKKIKLKGIGYTLNFIYRRIMRKIYIRLHLISG